MLRPTKAWKVKADIHCEYEYREDRQGCETVHVGKYVGPAEASAERFLAKVEAYAEEQHATGACLTGLLEIIANGGLPRSRERDADPFESDSSTVGAGAVGGSVQNAPNIVTAQTPSGSESGAQAANGAASGADAAGGVQNAGGSGATQTVSGGENGAQAANGAAEAGNNAAPPKTEVDKPAAGGTGGSRKPPQNRL